MMSIWKVEESTLYASGVVRWGSDSQFFYTTDVTFVVDELPLERH